MASISVNRLKKVFLFADAFRNLLNNITLIRI